MKNYKKQNPLLEDREDLAVLAIKVLRGRKKRDKFKKAAGSRRGKPEKEQKNKMNCKYEVQSFDWEMTAFKHSHLKCSHCPESKLLNINFSLFFCKMCRTYLSHEERLNTCVSIC